MTDSPYYTEELPSASALQEKLAVDSDTEKQREFPTVTTLLRLANRRCLILTVSVDKEHLVVADPEFDDPNIDPSAVPLGEWIIACASSQEI